MAESASGQHDIMKYFCSTKHPSICDEVDSSEVLVVSSSTSSKEECGNCKDEFEADQSQDQSMVYHSEARFSSESNNEDTDGEREGSEISKTVSSISDSNKQSTEAPVIKSAHHQTVVVKIKASLFNQGLV